MTIGEILGGVKVPPQKRVKILPQSEADALIMEYEEVLLGYEPEHYIDTETYNKEDK